MTATIETTLAALWTAYAGAARSGRFPCPVTVPGRGGATHIYQGFGLIRLERIAKLQHGKRGFQGEEIASVNSARPASRTITILD